MQLLQDHVTPIKMICILFTTYEVDQCLSNVTLRAHNDVEKDFIL